MACVQCDGHGVYLGGEGMLYCGCPAGKELYRRNFEPKVRNYGKPTPVNAKAKKAKRKAQRVARRNGR